MSCKNNAFLFVEGCKAGFIAQYTMLLSDHIQNLGAVIVLRGDIARLARCTAITTVRKLRLKTKQQKKQTQQFKSSFEHLPTNTCVLVFFVLPVAKVCVALTAGTTPLRLYILMFVGVSFSFGAVLCFVLRAFGGVEWTMVIIG